MLDLPLTHNYPVEISCKAEPMAAQFNEGLRQLSGFATLKTTQLNYLASLQTKTNLESTLDAAGGAGSFGWQFRPHYTLKQWRVGSYRTQILDKDRLYDLSLTLEEIRTAYPFTIPTAPLPLDLNPDEPPTITSTYQIRAPQLGYFPDRKPEPINPKVEKIQFTSTVELSVADSIDLLLERCRGVYPLVWEGSTYSCSSWQLSYYPESAQIQVDLDTFNLF